MRLIKKINASQRTRSGLLALCGVVVVSMVGAVSTSPTLHAQQEPPKKSAVSEDLKDSTESANSSAQQAMAALEAARAAVRAAKAADGQGEAVGAGTSKTGAPQPGSPVAAPSGAKGGAPKVGEKGGELPKAAVQPAMPAASAPVAPVAPVAPASPTAKPEPAPVAPGTSSAVKAEAGAPVKPEQDVTGKDSSAKSAAAAVGEALKAADSKTDAPKADGAPAPAAGEEPAPVKKKSRFGSSSDDAGEDGLSSKKKKTKKETGPPLTPEQAKAVEIKGFCDKARAAIRKGEFEVAQGLLESLVAVDLPPSEKKVALQDVSAVYEEKGDLTKSIAIYEKLCAVLESDLDIPAWLLKLGQLYRDAGAFQMAVSRYYGVIQLGMKMGSSDFTRYQGLTRQAQREIANTYFMKGEFEQAQKFYNMALRTDLTKEERAIAMFRSAHCTFMRNDMNTAVNSLERFLKDFSRHASAAEARYMLASAYKNLSRPQDAYDTVIELLRAAKGNAEADPKAWIFWQKKAGNEFANDYYQRGDFVNAVTIYQALAALETAPEWRWPVVYQMGLCFERLRLDPRAVECYKYIVEENLKPEFRWRKMPQSVGNLVKMAAWRVEQMSWESTTVAQLRGVMGNEVPKSVLR